MHITKRALRTLISEALEVVLTNSEAIEMFGDEVAPKLAESDDAVSDEISKLVKKGKSQEQAVAIALSMDKEGKLEEHDLDVDGDMDLGNSEIIQKLQQIVDGIGEVNRRLEDIDTSVDYAAGAISGDDPEKLQFVQSLGGRLGRSLTKEALHRIIREELDAVLEVNPFASSGKGLPRNQKITDLRKRAQDASRRSLVRQHRELELSDETLKLVNTLATAREPGIDSNWWADVRDGKIAQLPPDIDKLALDDYQLLGRLEGDSL